ncbi:uncharacterized protein MELLADRAFT_61038 [Melampsora larici-populina 98AG31]|uniref:Uncharacterized protein n=1 Tax=Melampsora larici-populina (strain 98AG31 / pathotype 3-4-7) TaxID=747676 RepID=F4RDC8_MELLP|nr:uncharacterized protein MELLADRAFT_61038 [Melampsora larici-populina 98AG31]EGG09379.1 hypothetical protein MELLADRAFT_61038 [Melampsora larici-populina 98AG31]
MELLKSPSETISMFWEKNNGAILYKERYPMLISHIQKLLVSNPKTWAKRMLIIFEEIEAKRDTIDPCKQITLFQILIQMIKIYKLPINFMLVVWAESVKISEVVNIFGDNIPQSSLWEDKSLWNNELAKTEACYRDEIIKLTKKLSPGRELLEFVAMQENHAPYGIKLTDDWTPEEQKDLFEFWMTKRILPFWITLDPRLKNILETQFVQTSLIKVLQNFPDCHLKIGCGFKHWAETQLRDQSKTVLQYINSLDGGFNCGHSYMFDLVQELYPPYGLKLNQAITSTQRIEIVKFWATHIVIFTRMKSFGETEDLNEAINLLVINNFDETSEIMKTFLENENAFDENTSILAQFLASFINITKDKAQEEIS